MDIYLAFGRGWHIFYGNEVWDARFTWYVFLYILWIYMFSFPVLVIAGARGSLVSLESCQAMASKLLNYVSMLSPSCHELYAKLINAVSVY